MNKKALAIFAIGMLLFLGTHRIGQAIALGIAGSIVLAISVFLERRKS